MDNFSGVKIALLLGDQVLVIQRDKKPGLVFSGLRDFPGGGREHHETPIECAVREIEEELAIRLDPRNIIWQKQHTAVVDISKTAYFMIAKITEADVKAIKFGNEGRGWKLMAVSEFMTAADVVEPLKARLQDYLNANAGN